MAALNDRPEIDPTCQWGTFLRNHDELTLDKLTEEERKEVFTAFGPEPDMQLYGRGLKRRLPPMLDGDPRRVRLAYSLMFSLPGTPTLYYGEEIGMGEDLSAEGRMAVRSPMQWSGGRNGGFSSATPSRLIQQVVPGGYGPDHVNFIKQRHDPDSLWTFMRELIGIRRTCLELGWGAFSVIDQPHPQVMAHQCALDDSVLVAMHNLGAEPITLSLPVVPVQNDAGDQLADDLHIVDMFTHEPIEPRGQDIDLALEGYGFRWLRIQTGRVWAHS